MPKAIWFPANAIKKVKINRADAAAFENIGRYDWIFFTSKNAARFFIDEMRSRWIQMPRAVKIAAVGPETARVLRSSGFKISLMPKKFSAEHLVSALGKKIAGKRVLFPRSAIASGDPVRELRENGARVDVIHLYTAIPVRIPETFIAAVKKGNVGYIVFTSPSSVVSFMQKMKQENMKGIAAKARKISAVCIGPSTAQAARAFQFKKIIVSKISTKAGIAGLLRRLP